MKPKNKTILVIEDDKKIMAALIIRLETAGYTVRTASNGFEGLKQILDEPPNLLLMDIWTPFGMGFSVAQYLQNIGLKDIPMIFMTGSKVEGLKDVAEQLGATAFFEKPYDPQQLLDAIARALDRPSQGKLPPPALRKSKFSESTNSSRRLKA